MFKQFQTKHTGRPMRVFLFLQFTPSGFHVNKICSKGWDLSECVIEHQIFDSAIVHQKVCREAVVICPNILNNIFIVCEQFLAKIQQTDRCEEKCLQILLFGYLKRPKVHVTSTLDSRNQPKNFEQCPASNLRPSLFVLDHKTKAPIACLIIQIY